MKKIILPLLVIVAIFIVAPFFIGSQAESKLKEIYAKANQNPNVKFEIVEYNRGWFSSDAKIELKIVPTTMQPTNDFTLVVFQHMQHGPILWKSNGLGLGLADTKYGVELSEEMQAELDKMEGLDKDAVTAVSRLSFDGSSTSLFTISPFTVNKDNKKIVVKGGEFRTSVEMSGKVTVDGEWQGMQAAENDQTIFDFGVLSIKLDQSLVSGEIFSPSALFEGAFNVSLAKMDIISPTPSETVQIDGMYLTTSTQFANDLAHFDFSLGAKNIKAIGQEFDTLSYDLSLENIDKEVMLELNNMLLQGDNIDSTIAMEKMQTLLPKLVANDPVFKLNRLGVNTSSGEINTTATVSIDKDSYDAANPMSLMMAVDASADGSAPESFFANLGLAADIDMMVQQNMLVRENDTLKFKIIFQNGQATLNGMAIPLGF